MKPGKSDSSEEDPSKIGDYSMESKKIDGNDDDQETKKAQPVEVYPEKVD